MSVDLVNDKGSSWYTGNKAWARILSLAMHYGWQPKGTLPPSNMPEEDQASWSGSYSVNYGQVVSQEDALNLADAIERALPDVLATPDEPDEGPQPVSHAYLYDLMTKVEEFASNPGLPPAYLGVTNLYAKKLGELVEFCRQGEFHIF